MGLREFNEYKISLLVRKDESNSGDLILQLPKTYAEGVWVRRQKETVLHHVESMIVHCTAKDHILLNTINQPKAFVVLDKDGYLGNDHFNPILIGINEEYPTFERLLATTLYTSPHDIGRVVMVLDALRNVALGQRSAIVGVMLVVRKHGKRLLKKNLSNSASLGKIYMLHSVLHLSRLIT